MINQINDIQADSMVNQFRQGMTIPQIASITGHSEDSITSALLSKGVCISCQG